MNEFDKFIENTFKELIEKDMKFWNCHGCNYTTDKTREFTKNHINKGHKVSKVVG